jgi:HEAT repeat protein
VGDAAAIAPLLAQLTDPLSPVALRQACAIALAELRASTALPALRAILADAENQAGVRYVCAQALGDLGDTSQAPLLEKLLRDANSPELVRGACAVAWAQIRDTESIPVLRELLLGDQHGIREACATALGLMGDRGSRGALLTVLMDPAAGELLRITCVKALGRIEAWTPDVCQGLIEVMQSRDEGGSLRQACAAVLSRIPDPAARDALLAVHVSGQLANSWSLLETVYRTQGHRPLPNGWETC